MTRPSTLDENGQVSRQERRESWALRERGEALARELAEARGGRKPPACFACGDTGRLSCYKCPSAPGDPLTLECRACGGQSGKPCPWCAAGQACGCGGKGGEDVG